MPRKVTLNYVVLDVFTEMPYVGNPLAVVHIPPSTQVTQEQKLHIAREFNLSETVFIHDDTLPKDGLNPDQLADSPITIDIFITEGEIPFAGHPTVGTGCYLLQTLLPTKFPSTTFTKLALQTKAGIIPVNAVTSPTLGVSLRVPTDFKIHEPYAHPQLKSTQSQLTDADFVGGSKAPVPVVSIVKGMTFFLLELASEGALGRLQGSSRADTQLPEGYLGAWDGLLCVYAFVQGKDVVRTRMFMGSMEDPATGSAASALCAYLGQSKGPGKRAFHVVQGVEMGRKSEISVVVDVDQSGAVSEVLLQGPAVQVMRDRKSVV